MFVKVLEEVISGIKTGKKGRKSKQTQEFSSDATPLEQKMLEEKRVQQKAQALQDSGIFANVPFGNVLELARKSPMVSFSRGDIIIAEGKPAHSVYVIVEGQAVHKKTDSVGRMITGALMEHGGVMGLESILIDTGSLASLEVASDYVTCVEIPSSVFIEFADLHTVVYRAVTQKILTYTQGLFDVISAIKGKADARERILLKRRELEKKELSELRASQQSQNNKSDGEINNEE